MVESSPTPHPFDFERWRDALQFFRYRHAVGGHANDGDVLVATLAFADEIALVALFEGMGRPLVVLAPDAPVPIPGAQYTIEEYEGLRHRIGAFPRYEAPGRTHLFGVSAYVSVTGEAVQISIAGADGDPYVVTEHDAENALRIEAGLFSIGARRL